MDVPASIAVLGSDGAIAADLACSACGYNLRGLTLAGRCPECGTVIARSAFGNALRVSDPGWVEKLRRGASLLRWYIVISILTGLAAGAAAGVLGVRNSGAVSGLGAFLLPIGLVVQFLGVAGAFLVTTQEPRVAFTEDPVTLRKVVRTCAVATFVGRILNDALSALAGGTGGGIQHDLAIVVLAVSIALSLAGIVGFFGQFVYFRRFALRVPDEPLARATRTVMWGFVASIAVTMLGAGIAQLAGSFNTASGGGSGSPSGGRLAGTIGGGMVACAAMVSLVVFVCWAYRLLLRYNRAFAEAAGQARAFAAQYPEAVLPVPA